ncbi:hypothetical protein HYT01_01225 [Candidatus Giovannonibacteria bacterium]|nr:hypothetical protein [Candidatus Giovannonibacteria bacterium]
MRLFPVRLPKIFHVDISNVHHAAFWLSIFALISGILGLFRDRLLAGMFGASRSLDLYYAAFRVPDFVYTMMLFFAASTAIIPIFLSVKKDSGEDGKSGDLLGSLILFFGLLVSLSSLLVFFLMPKFASFLFPGFTPDEQGTVILLSRVLLLSPIFLGLSNILSSVTQTFGRFFVYALSPVVYNLGIIIGVLFLYPLMGFQGLGWGVVLGTFLHMAVQVPSVIKIGVRPSFKNLWSRELKKVIALSVPRTLGLATTQISLTVFTSIASVFAQGSISVFNFATNLEYLPVTLIGLSYSVAVFPRLAALSISKAKDGFKENFSVAFRHIVFWALPSAVLILVLRAQIVRVILGSGKFSWADTRLTAAVLSLLAFAVVLQSLFMLLVRAFYAEGETYKPLIVNIISAFLSAGSAFWLSKIILPGSAPADFLGSLLRISDISDIRVIALPLGVLIGNIFNLVFLFLLFKKVFGWYPDDGSRPSFLQVLSASLISGVTAYASLAFFTNFFDLDTFPGIFMQGLFSGLLGLVALIFALWALGNRELFELHASLVSKFSRKEQVPAPEPEKLP